MGMAPVGASGVRHHGRRAPRQDPLRTAGCGMGMPSLQGDRRYRAGAGGKPRRRCEVARMNGRLLKVSAPGKLVLMGEYAVRDGAPALVAALDRRVEVEVPSESDENGLPNRARRMAARLMGLCAPPEPCRADSTPLHAGSEKLGLGSSAAVVVAAVGALFWEAGRDPVGAMQRQELFRVAHRVHDRLSGSRGSGVDVAASLFGGMFFYRRTGNGSCRLQRWRRPPNLSLTFWWTGRSADTARRLERVDRKRKESAVLDRLLLRMADCSRRFTKAETSRQCLELMQQYRRLMENLGDLAGFEMLGGRERRLADLAEELGGAVKPSGAGGGDCLVAAFADGRAERRWVEAASGSGLAKLRAEVDEKGLVKIA
ncbi:MAG: hypothetical protein D6806_18085 [Deltaproteobacteria bacterium]|nr:MAG: hypothetical protein D6806_18085 [Deltaproteobacteria bacterium]